MADVTLKALAAAAMVCLALNAAAEEIRTFAASLADGRLVGAEDTVRVVEGDTVVLRWTADRPAELHLHGYDVLARATPGSPMEMRFVAHAPGRFPVEYHGPDGDHRVVLYIEIHPE